MAKLKTYLALAMVGVLQLATLETVAAQAAPTGAGATSMPALQPGDIIRLQIWREPDLSGEFPVDPNGIVTFPKLGPMDVRTESAESLRSKLVAGYQEYLRNPSIEVTLLRRVIILGAVRNPGLYPVDPTLTIADAVALAGGATPEGNRREIELLRAGQQIGVKLNDAVRIADLPLRSGDQIFVPERSWMARNTGLIATLISAATSLVIAFSIR